MGMYAKVRRLYFRERLSINEIKRQTSLSRNTIKQWIKEGEGAEPKYVPAKVVSKITPYDSLFFRFTAIWQTLILCSPRWISRSLSRSC